MAKGVDIEMAPLDEDQVRAKINLVRRSAVVYALDALTISRRFKHKDLCVPIFESAYAERTPTADLEDRSLDRSITRLAPVCQPYEVCDVDNGHMC